MPASDSSKEKLYKWAIGEVTQVGPGKGDGIAQGGKESMQPDGLYYNRRKENRTQAAEIAGAGMREMEMKRG